MRLSTRTIAFFLACIGAALPSMASEPSQPRNVTPLTRADANRIMHRVVSQGYYRGGAFEEMPKNAGEAGFYMFQIFRTNAKGGESDVSGFIGISRRTGRIVEVDAEWCRQYPVHEGDKPLKPYPGADLPAVCEDPALGE